MTKIRPEHCLIWDLGMNTSIGLLIGVPLSPVFPDMNGAQWQSTGNRQRTGVNNWTSWPTRQAPLCPLPVHACSWPPQFFGCPFMCLPGLLWSLRDSLVMTNWLWHSHFIHCVFVFLQPRLRACHRAGGLEWGEREMGTQGRQHSGLWGSTCQLTTSLEWA